MGHLHFEVLSQANYTRMTLISKVSPFEITPVPVWNEGEVPLVEQFHIVL